MNTLILLGSRRLADGRVLTHGSELPPGPGVLTETEIATGLDAGCLRESQRRSLYALFPAFAGVAVEQQALDVELGAFALPG